MDSGASDHMIGDARIFSTYSPCHENFYVRIADGSLSRVTGTGSMVISKNLTLNSVLLVPNLDCNLFSISKQTQELNCVTKFFPNLCEFPDLNSGKTIGNAKMGSVSSRLVVFQNNKLTRQIRTRQKSTDSDKANN